MLIQYCISYLTVGVILLGISIIVFYKNPQSIINRIFAAYSFFIAWWSIFSIPAILSTDNYIGASWCRVFIIGPIFIPTLFLHFVLAFLKLDKKYKWLIKVCYVISIFFLISNATKFFIKAAEPRFSLRSYTIPGPLFHFHFLFFVVVATVGILFLFNGLLKTFRAEKSSYNRMRISYLFWSTLLGYIGGTPNYLLVYRIELPFLNPFATYAVAIYGMVVAYIIVRYRLLEINIALTRTGIFVAVYTIVLGLPFAVAISLKARLIEVLGANWWTLPLGLMAVLATVGPFIYIYIDRKAEERLLREQKRYQQTLKEASVGMTRIRNLRKLLDLIAHIITRTVRISYAAIYLHNHETGEFILQVSRDKGRTSLMKLDSSNPVLNWLTTTREPLIYDEIQRLAEDTNLVAYQDVAANMRSLSASVAIPSFLEDRFMGLLVLGEKTSGQIYTPEDLNVFRVLASQAALAIENAQFYEETKEMQAQIAQAEKMATIGTMADGLSHQINNRFHALSLITGDTLDTIKMTDTSKCSPEIKKMLENINHALERISVNVTQGGEVVKGLLKYSRRGDEGFEPLDLNTILDNTLEMVQYKVKLSEIDLVRKFPKDLPRIKGNLVQLQEVFFNFIDNAYDATLERKNILREENYRGKITISAAPKDTKLEITVQDNGIGIKKEDARKIFTPFFTTKATSSKGTGLGLYVISKIITDAHKGKVDFESRYKEGTRFILELPIAK